MRRRRGLSEEDEALWRLVVRDVAPLRPRRRRIDAPAAVVPAAPEPPVQVSQSAEPSRGAPPARPARPGPPPAPPLAPIDRHERRAVLRGTRAIEGRLDLHGFRQDEAQAMLGAFLRRSQEQGRRLVLVITGKGSLEPGAAFGLIERGVLRRVVPHWLGAPELRGLVMGFEEAGAGHGGSGALYVRLRRPKRT